MVALQGISRTGITLLKLATITKITTFPAGGNSGTNGKGRWDGLGASVKRYGKRYSVAHPDNNIEELIILKKSKIQPINLELRSIHWQTKAE